MPPLQGPRLGREALIAALIGVNSESDLYYDAFLIPDFLNYLLAGAYLTITLVPILARHLESDDRDGASAAFTSVFRFVAIAMLILTGIMWIFAPVLVDVVFPRSPIRPAWPASRGSCYRPQVFLVLGALFMAVQYTHKRFLIPRLCAGDLQPRHHRRWGWWALRWAKRPRRVSSSEQWRSGGGELRAAVGRGT